MKARLLVFLPFFLLLFLCLLAWQEGLHINLTGSMPRGFYKTEDAPLILGDLAAFCLGGNDAALALGRGYLKPGICPSGTQPLLKEVAALPGDTATVAESGICITPAGRRFGCLWPAKPLPADSKGLPLTAEAMPGIIPPGMALLLTPHPGSFDGRYFGLVSLNALTRVAPFYLISLE